MKRFIGFCFTLICVIAVFAVLYMDGYLDYTPLYDIIYYITHLDSERVPSPIKEGDMVSFYVDESVGAECSGNVIRLNTVTNDSDKKHLVVLIEENDIEVEQYKIETEAGQPNSLAMNIPEGVGDRIEVAVYANSTEYGTFRSWVNNYLYFVRTSDGWVAEESPVLDHNKELFTQPKVLDSALESTRNVEADNPSITAVAKRITADCSTDYEKALALHDYVCETLYYDFDMAAKSIIPIESAAEVILSGRGVCSGYANVYAALCRSVGLPCVVVTGYAIGSEMFEMEWNEENAATGIANHAWNEVYADGRWIIVDTTWDSGNYYENGQEEDAFDASHVYFDANLEMFSANHKILKYKDI